MLSEEQYPYSITKQLSAKHGLEFFKFKIRNIINWNGNRRQTILLHGKKNSNEYPKMFTTLLTILKVKSLELRENLPRQKSIAKSVFPFKATTNKIRRFCLLLRFNLKMGENIILPELYIITLDETWVHLSK